MKNSKLDESVVVVAKSTIPNAGRGVFVKSHVKKGEFLCFYDGYFVNKNEEQKIKNIGVQDFALDTYDGSGIIVGHKEPKCVLGVGQLVNDACMLHLPETNESMHIVPALIRDYEKRSRAKSNTIFREQNKWYRMYARRDLRAGDELFFSYGSNYWLSHQYLRSSNCVCRFLCQLCQSPPALKFRNGKLQNFTEDEARDFIEDSLVMAHNNSKWIKLKCRNSSALEKLNCLYKSVASQ